MKRYLFIFPFILIAPILYSQSISISDDFEGGNIDVISINNSDNTILVAPALRPGDTKASHFYFKVKGYSRSRPFYIRLYTSEAYYAPVLAGYSYDNTNWERVSAVNYPGYKVYTLSPGSDSLFFSIGYPYTWTDMISHINSHSGNPCLDIQDLCLSEQGRTVKLLKVTDPSFADSVKSLIWIIARQHAFESHSNYVIEGLIDEILSENETAARLRAQSITYIIPVMDVDNIYNGGTGKDQNPVDFNRDWDSPSYWNAVNAAKNKIAETVQQNKLEVFIDSHDPFPGDDNVASRLFLYALHDTGTASCNVNYFRDLFEDEGGYPLDRQELYPTIGQTANRYADSLYYPGLCFSIETGWVYRTDDVLWDIAKYKNNGRVLLQSISNYINNIPSPGDIIIDNRDSSSVSYAGDWISSSYVAGYYGEDYVHDNNEGKGLKSVEFNPGSINGVYEVFLRWTSAAGRAVNVPIKIYHSDGITECTVNQEKRGAGWNSLGIYNFSEGSLSNIKIETTGTGGYVIADAVRLSSRPGLLDISDSITDVKELILFQNYPNPFNPATTISYIIPEEGNKTTLKLFDILGSEAAILINKEQSAGMYEFNFDLSYLPGGVYFYRLNSGKYSVVKKMLLLK